MPDMKCRPSGRAGAAASEAGGGNGLTSSSIAQAADTEADAAPVEPLTKDEARELTAVNSEFYTECEACR